MHTGHRHRRRRPACGRRGGRAATAKPKHGCERHHGQVMWRKQHNNKEQLRLASETSHSSKVVLATFVKLVTASKLLKNNQKAKLEYNRMRTKTRPCSSGQIRKEKGAAQISE